MVTVTSHIFINIFETVHFFTRGNEREYELFADTKILESLKKKSEAIGPGSFNTIEFLRKLKLTQKACKVLSCFYGICYITGIT